MGFETPSTVPTTEDKPEEKRNLREEASMNRTRILSDAEFIKGGASVGANGEIRPTPEQITSIQERLKRAEDVIENLEGHFFQEEMTKLQKQGEKLDREVAELHRVSDRLNLNEWFVTHNAALSGEVREDGVKEFKENEEKFEELRKRLGGFFMEVQRFASRYGIERLGGVNLSYEKDGNELKLAKNIGEHFGSLEELFDAMTQVRDAKLYRAYSEKKEITGSM